MPRLKGCADVDPFTRGRVIGRHEKGDSERTIARDLSLSKTAVHNIISRYLANGQTQAEKRTGRFSMNTPRMERTLVRSVLKSRRQRLVDISRENMMSSQTARRTLHRLGYHGRVAKKKPYLTRVHIRKRKEWALEMAKKPESFWENVIFSDESKFELFGTKRRAIVWRRPGEEYLPSCLRGSVKFGGGSVMVWAAIWLSGKSELVFIDGDKYMEILDLHLLPVIRNDMDVIFQHDGATCHTASKTKKWISDNLMQMLQWVPQSPDMNPIEHVWDYLDSHL